MNQTLLRRGPDDGGTYRAPGVGLAMRRLSIIDLAGGHQPIQNEDGSIWLVYNGEIYNYRELRVELEQRGHRFRTGSDTEVIAHLYEEYGDKLVHHLRGMFAFALWDTHNNRGLIARDRLGIKPLFYSQVRDTLIFGSEIKAVLASGVVTKELDYQALDAYFAFTYIPAPLSIYRSVRKLEAGHLLIYESGHVSEQRYWDIDFSDPDDALTGQEWVSRLDAAIEDAVDSHLISDVPIGAFLSGGIDSSLVVSMMSQHLKEPVQTSTIGFEGLLNPLIDERPLAEMIAKRYGCRHNAHAIRANFRHIVGDIINSFDEPFADDSVIPSYYVSQFTRQHVKVALTGLGGDELFAGYQRYSGVLLSRYYSHLVPRSLHRHIVAPLVRSLPEPSRGGDRIDHAKRFSVSVMQSPAERYLGFVSTIPTDERPHLFSRDVAKHIDYRSTECIITDRYEQCNAPDDLARALYVDIKTYLPEDILALSDRLSMWHSLEVRVPLVDHLLVELSARLPSQYKLNWHRKKILLKSIARRHIPTAIIEHRKQGFESPMAAWLRTDLAEYARDILSPHRLRTTGLFNPHYVSAKLEDHLGGRHKNNKLIFSLIMFQEWYERQMV